VLFLDLKFSLLAFDVKLKLLVMSRVEYWELFNVSANISVAIFSGNMFCLVDLSRLIWGRQLLENWI